MIQTDTTNTESLRLRTRRSRRVRVGAAAALLGLTLPLAACGTDDDSTSAEAAEATEAETEDAAESTDSVAPAATDASTEEAGVGDAAIEGNLVLYSTISDVENERLVEAFTAMYPDVQMTVNRKGSGDLAAQLEVEFESDNVVADVLVTSGTQFVAAHPDEFVVIESEHLEEPVWEAQASEGDKTVLFRLSPWGIGRNLDSTDPIESWEELATLDDDLLLGILDANATTGFATWWHLMTDELGDEWAQGVSQGAKLYATQGTFAPGAGSGEIDVAVALSGYAQYAIDDGLPLELTFPEPVWTTPSVASVLSDAPNPAAAQALVDFLLAPEGQEAVNQYGYSVLPDIPGTLGDTSDTAGYLPIDEVTPEDLEEWRATFNANAGL